MPVAAAVENTLLSYVNNGDGPIPNEIKLYSKEIDSERLNSASNAS